MNNYDERLGIPVNFHMNVQAEAVAREQISREYNEELRTGKIQTVIKFDITAQRPSNTGEVPYELIEEDGDWVIIDIFGTGKALTPELRSRFQEVFLRKISMLIQYQTQRYVQQNKDIILNYLNWYIENLDNTEGLFKMLNIDIEVENMAILGKFNNTFSTETMEDFMKKENNIKVDNEWNYYVVITMADVLHGNDGKYSGLVRGRSNQSQMSHILTEYKVPEDLITLEDFKFTDKGSQNRESTSETELQ